MSGVRSLLSIAFIGTLTLQACGSIASVDSTQDPAFASEQPSKSEHAEWQRAFSSLGSSYPGSLHDAPASFIDGAKGYHMGHVTNDRVQTSYPSGVTTFADYKVWTTVCTFPLIAAATFRGAAAFLINQERAIVTRATFTLDDVVQAPDGFSAGSLVAIGQPGGEVIDDGERLRLIAEDSGPPYIIGAQYLIIARRAGGLTEKRFVAGPGPILKVDALIYPEGATDRWSLVGSIDEYARLKRSLIDMGERVPCRPITK